MSYDVLAFDPSEVSDESFGQWWREQATWPEGHSYDDAAVATAPLRAFYGALSMSYPPMNGPDAPSDEAVAADPSLEHRMTDYSIGTSLVYAAFAWSEADAARELSVALAATHGVALALVSDGDEILRPAPDTVRHAKHRRFWRRHGHD